MMKPTLHLKRIPSTIRCATHAYRKDARTGAVGCIGRHHSNWAPEVARNRDAHYDFRPTAIFII